MGAFPKCRGILLSNADTLGILQPANIKDKIQKLVYITRKEKRIVEIEHEKVVKKHDVYVFGMIGGTNLGMIDSQLSPIPMALNHYSHMHVEIVGYRSSQILHF